MIARLGADGVVAFHFCFVLFVGVGGLLALRWPRVAYAHLPVAVWGVLVEWTSLICPLTYLENRLRTAAGMQGYQGGFIARYMVPLIYPEGLTRGVQIAIGVGVLTLNVAVYAALLQRRRARRGPAPAAAA